jgi:CHAD domain-containing protein
VTTQRQSWDDEKIPSPSEQIRRLIERLAFQANRTAKAPRPEAVHDLRVATRRCEQALVAFKAEVSRKAQKRIRKQLKSVLSCAGLLRDHDIAGKILAKTKQPGATALQRRILLQRKEAEKSLLVSLRRLSLRTRVSRWCEDLKLNEPPADFGLETLRERARGVLPRLAQRFFQAGETASAHSSGEKLHEFRILAKKFRYSLELFAPVYGSAVEEWTREIKSVQAILGSMNDYRTVLSMATEAGCGKKVKASLKRSERRKIRQFHEAWDERFSGAAASAAWLRALRLGAENRIPRKPITRATPEARRAAAASE